MKEFIEKGTIIDIVLDNEKVVKVSTKYIYNMMDVLDIDMEDAVLTWLEDEGYLINEAQEELMQKAKENKVLPSLHRAKERDNKPKTQKERVIKENPTKEMVIAKIAEILPEFATNIVVENKGKLITFTIGDNDFKLDLVQKRKPKADK